MPVRRLPFFTSFSIFFFLLISSTFSYSEQLSYDEPSLNGHDGYQTAWDKNGPLDKVLLIVAGFDVVNKEHPKNYFYEQYKGVLDRLSPLGWDVIYFDYVNGSIDLKDNADNLARFIQYLDTQANTNYHLAVAGGSMGGIVARTMFVQEYNDMGVNTFVTIDSPHWGVTLSEWVDDFNSVFMNFKAGYQMINGTPDYNDHYGWLRSIENDGAFMTSIIDPMATCAIALSNAEEQSWKVNWDDIAIHNKYYSVASYVDAQGLRSTFMPYHSSVYMDDRSTDKKVRFGYTQYQYKDTSSRYFDSKIPNTRTVHGGPEAGINQAVSFILKNHR